MVSAPVLFDTCILIDYLRGVRAAEAECDRHINRAISVISWMEVMAGAKPERESAARTFMENFEILWIAPEIAERAYLIRRESRIKLPDAIIQATAETSGRLLVTRNTRDFPSGTPGVRIPYQL